ncbi:YegS/Rv2252/BmrU family lipid kinase [Thalassobacillus hwangdonensis]|uniref:YegS/Rv2252/BmrU family lipid kinase n=1 Tax=Thalassobacillus hwangdonensis TaxID=546108 RepID=A0ABW3KZM8_9BACI
MPRYNRALFLYNGNAGSDNLEQKLSKTLPILAQEIKELTVVQTKSIDEAKEVCLEYGEVVELVLILGGDGTLHACCNTLAELDKRPVIGVLPGGTSNDFSRLLGMPQNLSQAASAIINGREAPVDAGKVNGGYFLNFWGIGLVTETSLNIDENQKNRLGVLSYFISALKTMNQATPFNFRLELDGEVMEDEAVMVLVLNGKFIGTRRIPIDSIDAGDGLLDIMIVKNSNLTMFKELLTANQAWSDEDSFQELCHRRAERITIEATPNQQSDMDGELKGETPTTIEVVPNHFTFLYANSEE